MSEQFFTSTNCNSQFFFKKSPVFIIDPDAFELAYNNSIIINLEACYNEKGVQEENFYCHAMIQGQKDKKMIIQTHVSATFVDPTVELSKKVLSFRINIGPNNFVDASLEGFLFF